ncbi:hypothetical protein V6N11_044454 [Hibiscus sabdariffa]|uniref:Uncharacterized protein n=2 Tax=Hibiscus sabdariffa TaxID=183260 RepID=A0ABR1ZI97_9ROSI
MPKPSFREVLSGRHGNNLSSLVITYLYVEVLDDDVQISSVDGTPVIKFSDKVHGLVDAKLANARDLPAASSKYMVYYLA